MSLSAYHLLTATNAAIKQILDSISAVSENTSASKPRQDRKDMRVIKKITNVGMNTHFLNMFILTLHSNLSGALTFVLKATAQ